MTIEDFQLLAWLRVGKAVALVIFYIAFNLGITRFYNETGVRLGGFQFMLRYFIITQIITLILSVSNLSDSLNKPEEMIQQYIEQQIEGTSGPFFDVPEEFIMREKGDVA